MVDQSKWQGGFNWDTNPNNYQATHTMGRGGRGVVVQLKWIIIDGER